MTECLACRRYLEDPRSYELGSRDSTAALQLEIHHAYIAELVAVVIRLGVERGGPL